ncbi:MAG: biopolymer transport protein ExbB [Crocinitomix sp.]|jgi:biopolymer transport protein ExbB
MKSIVTFIALFLVINLQAQPVGYDYGKLITVNSSEVSGVDDLINFTVLINVVDPDLKSVLNGGHVESENGYDLIFISDDCSTVMTHQIEKYDPVTGTLIVWVKLTALSAVTNTNFHLYYGNNAIIIDPSSYATWDAEYEGIWHMNNDPSTGLLLDYSGNGIDGTSHGAMTLTDVVSGKIGDAIDFDGSNDYFALALKSYATIGAIPEMTVSGWVKTSYSGGNTNNWSILDFDRSEYYNIWVTGNGRLCYSTSRTGSTFDDSYAGSSGDLNDNSWHHVVGVYNGTDKFLYIDGVLSLTDLNPHGGAGIGTGVTRFAFIGDGSEANSYNGSRNNIYYDGVFDEIRFTNSALTADWIQTEYNNQNNPTSFHTVGIETAAEDLCLLLPIELFDFTVEKVSSKVRLEWVTLSERNNDFFTIEHSIDAVNWTPIMEIPGAGNSSSQLNYFEFHNTPKIGINYYRLKQTDYDRKFEYFKTKSIQIDPYNVLNVYPNPAENMITVISKEDLIENDIRIFDLTGRDVTNLVSFSRLTDNQFELKLSELSNGIYLINSSQGVHQFIKN